MCIRDRADPAPPAATRGRREQKPSPPERQLLDKQPGGGRGPRHLLLSRRITGNLLPCGKEVDVRRNYSRLTSGPISVNRYSMGPGTIHPDCWEPADSAETSPPPGLEPMTPSLREDRRRRWCRCSSSTKQEWEPGLEPLNHWKLVAVVLLERRRNWRRH